ncbi:MAG: 7-cyano-7-deazaguanine synthase [Desulfurococcaceae archaeon]|nr:7-cyano-7-deazaguanine synthase [Desulfurococcaceae archaeon]
MSLRMPCDILARNLLETLIKTVDECSCDCIALSGGIDTTTILLAAVLAGLKPRGYVVFYKHGLPKDLYYVNQLSKLFNIDIKYLIIDLSNIKDLVINVTKCIGEENLDTHRDGGCVEIRNDIVFYTVLKQAKDDGCKCIFTGTGGDEVFAGYSFMLNLTENELIEAIKKLSKGIFSEVLIANCVNIKICTPLSDPRIIDIVENIPIDCLRSQLMRGKEILRYILSMYGLHTIADRMKIPAEGGAGTKDICKSILDD